jgi:hypothetical protein
MLDATLQARIVLNLISRIPAQRVWIHSTAEKLQDESSSKSERISRKNVLVMLGKVGKRYRYHPGRQRGLSRMPVRRFPMLL